MLVLSLIAFTASLFRPDFFPQRVSSFLGEGVTTFLKTIHTFFFFLLLFFFIFFYFYYIKFCMSNIRTFQALSSVFFFRLAIFSSIVKLQLSLSATPQRFLVGLWFTVALAEGNWHSSAFHTLMSEYDWHA